jgi:Zn-dependent peptidase ImmA (M78 family)
MDQAAFHIPFRDDQEIERLSGEILRSLAPLDFPCDAFEISARLDVPVSLVYFSDPDISGMLIRQGDRSEIHVRRRDPYARQNFTVAHELGHFVLHPAGSWTDTITTMYRRDYWQRDLVDRRAEYQANLFAAALLMPEAVVRERWDLLKSLSYLAPCFRVSRRALFRRLDKLGLIVPSIEGFSYLDFTRIMEMPPLPKSAPLSDYAGEIPAFPPVAVDEHGRIIPMSQAEREARQAALSRVLNVASRPDRIDPPELLE